MNGFYEYQVSPYQLKPFAGFFAPGAVNLARRTGSQLAFILPPALFFYFVASWSDKQVCNIVLGRRGVAVVSNSLLSHTYRFNAHPHNVSLS
jgi:hypothetical protein